MLQLLKSLSGHVTLRFFTHVEPADGCRTVLRMYHTRGIILVFDSGLDIKLHLNAVKSI